MVSAKNAEGLPHSRIGHYSRQENEHVRPNASSALFHDEFCRAHGTLHRSAPTALLVDGHFRGVQLPRLGTSDRRSAIQSPGGARQAPSTIGKLYRHDPYERFLLSSSSFDNLLVWGAHFGCVFFSLV